MKDTFKNCHFPAIPWHCNTAIKAITYCRMYH